MTRYLLIATFIGFSFFGGTKYQQSQTFVLLKNEGVLKNAILSDGVSIIIENESANVVMENISGAAINVN